MWDCLADNEGGKTAPDNGHDVSPASAQTILSKDFMTLLFTLPAMEALKGFVWYPVQSVCEAKPSQREGSWDSLSNTFSWDIGSDTALVRGTTQTLSWGAGGAQMLRFEMGNWESQAGRGRGQHQSGIPENTATLTVQSYSLGTAGMVTEHHVEPVANTHHNQGRQGEGDGSTAPTSKHKETSEELMTRGT